MTPKNFVSDTLFISLPSSSMLISAWLCFLLNSIHDVLLLLFFNLSLLRLNLLTFNHSAISVNSELICISISSRFFPFWNKLESSAKNIGIVYLQTFARSFIYIYIGNKRGPCMDPRGTPLLHRVGINHHPVSPVVGLSGCRTNAPLPPPPPPPPKKKKTAHTVTPVRFPAEK